MKVWQSCNTGPPSFVVCCWAYCTQLLGNAAFGPTAMLCSQPWPWSYEMAKNVWATAGAHAPLCTGYIHSNNAEASPYSAISQQRFKLLRYTSLYQNIAVYTTLHESTGIYPCFSKRAAQLCIARKGVPGGEICGRCYEYTTWKPGRFPTNEKGAVFSTTQPR